MNLLCDSKAMEGLHKLINKCTSEEKAPDEHCTIRKIGKHRE